MTLEQQIAELSQKVSELQVQVAILQASGPRVIVIPPPATPAPALQLTYYQWPPPNYKPYARYIPT